MDDDLFVENVCKKLAQLILSSEHFKSKRDFALNAGIDEKTLRLILQGNYNMSLKILKRICDCLEISPSEVLKN